MILNMSSDFLDAVILEVSVVRRIEGALPTCVAVEASTITAMRAPRDRFPVGS